VTDDPELELAAILVTGDVESLYSGLSVLASIGTEGGSCAALASFRALALLLDPDLGRAAQEPDMTPDLSWAGRETFGRSLAELRDTVLALENVDVWACSASVETMALSAADVEEKLAGVMSTPRFLRLVAGAHRLIHI
jgi:hypothetical protein